MAVSEVKVSLIVPFYGVERYIGACAESLMRQTVWPQCEFIFVDDGSKDGSLAVLQEVLARFPERRTRIIRKENGGLPQARLTGLQAASGTYILHVDSDDWLEADMVEQLLQAAERTDADMAYCFVMNEYGYRRRVSRDRKFVSCRDYAKAMLRFRAHGYLWNKLIRRSLFREELFYPSIGMHEDMVLSGQVLMSGNACVQVPVPLYHYRKNNASSISGEQKKKRDTASARSFLQLVSYWQERPQSASVQEVLPFLYAYCAWKAICYAPELFEEYPFLREKAARVPGKAMPSIKYRYRLFRVKRWLRKH